MKAYLPKGSSFPFRLRLALTRSIALPPGLHERRRAVTRRPVGHTPLLGQRDGAIISCGTRRHDLCRVAVAITSHEHVLFVGMPLLGDLPQRLEGGASRLPGVAAWPPSLLDPSIRCRSSGRCTCVLSLELPRGQVHSNNPPTPGLTHNPPLFLFLSFQLNPIPSSLSGQTTSGQGCAASHTPSLESSPRLSQGRSIVEKLDKTSPDFMYELLALILFENSLSLFPSGTWQSRRDTFLSCLHRHVVEGDIH